jgi:hypothetical protein
MDVTEAIGVRLEYFQELEHSIRMLNHPGEALVLQTDFLLMVERVDVCIEYLQAHVRLFCLNRILYATNFRHAAPIQRSGFISSTISTMHDSSNDFDKDVFCWHYKGARCRCAKENKRQGEHSRHQDLAFPTDTFVIGCLARDTNTPSVL